MKTYTYQNDLINKKQLRQLLSWSFTSYDSMQACDLADELKYLGFKYASQAGISISIEDLKVPFIKNFLLKKANQEILNAEKIYLKGRITEVERFQKIIDTWGLTSESLKNQVIYFFKNYDPLNSVYIMAFSGARGNLSQVRQLVGMRGLMSDPNGEIMNLPIKKNFREGLSITDYLMSGYGARKGIVDTALKTANSGYLTRRLIDVGQDILIREKDCLTNQSFLIDFNKKEHNSDNFISDKLIGRTLNKSLFDSVENNLILSSSLSITRILVKKFQEQFIQKLYIRSPFTCNLYRSICQKCYGWDLSNENLVDIGEAIGILAGQSIGEPGTQLTMRTFHTGGIFTSEARQQIISPVNGIIKFFKLLKTVLIRTNRGEDVLVAKNSGSIIIVPKDKTKKIIQIEILRNTILFPKNNQYILKDTVIGELINLKKQIKTEVKPILSDSCGEIFIPKLKKKINGLNNNKLLWILSGQVYDSPKNSFINFFNDYKINNKNSIFRTKLINHSKGYLQFLHKNQSFWQKSIQIQTNSYSFFNSYLKKLKYKEKNKNYLFKCKNSKYLIKIIKSHSKYYLQLTRNKKIGTKISNFFRTLNGGILYYDYFSLAQKNKISRICSYSIQTNLLSKYYPLISFQTIIWLNEETHKVNCESKRLLAKNGDFIAKNFELTSGLFSKNSGIVEFKKKQNSIQTISIKSGIVYEGKNFKTASNKFYYPGELLFSTIPIERLSVCETILKKNKEQLLLRTIEIYEISRSNFEDFEILANFGSSSKFFVNTKTLVSYKPNQSIQGAKNINLVSKILTFSSLQFFKNATNMELILKKKKILFNRNESVHLKNYILPNLRYKKIQSCFLPQQNQFLDCYNLLGYFETIAFTSLEIVRAKIKNKMTKKILLISNKDCFIVEKKKFPRKKLNDFIINSITVNENGKIIIENKKFYTVQKGIPYFFPYCKSQKFLQKNNFQYKVISPNRICKNFSNNHEIQENYYDVFKFSVGKQSFAKNRIYQKIKLKVKFSKLFIKRNGKFYNSLLPQILKKFSIRNSLKQLKSEEILKPKLLTENVSNQLYRTLLFQSSEFIPNNYHKKRHSKKQLALVTFVQNSFLKSNKSIGIYSITEDYFAQDANSVFCKNNEFIESGETLGLLKLEKEITGDIVQGLPRIEEILEARKKNFVIKKLPTSKKKGLLVQKSSLDTNFEFKKLGITIKESEKINPHKLLKVYFNYYGLVKYFFCDKLLTVQYNRLIKNYEGSYKSFKKVQSFILSSVQSVYSSQGVAIHDKHLEVIIKQMTTKVLITHEGNTPLLRREVIDLYHIQHINKIVKFQGKQSAYYVPLLLGITKAALNNPSFLSAASFQETTRILTKAAIEGKIDWLRGLKENIIIGHLIPAGTGSQNYRNSFQKERKSISNEVSSKQKK